MIPKGLTDEHFRKAAARIDAKGVPPVREAVFYDLIIDGKKYPPKYIVSIAAKFASGKEFPPQEFNAVEAKNYFISLGYKIIDRRKEAEKLITPEDDESTFPEGRELFKQHRILERDSAIVRKAKARRLAETGHLECEACTFDFAEVYGSIGVGFIEAHHTTPVSKLRGKTKTKIGDLASVCSNCHRMLHRGKEQTSVSGLKKLIESNT